MNDDGLHIATTNAALAGALREVAERLAAQGANPFRVAAYRRAADTVQDWAEPLARVFARDGVDGLDALPHVGKGISAALAELLASGRWALLEQLREGGAAEAALMAVPGIGAELAHRLHDELGLDTLEALEAAAHDGRLRQVHGLGARRAQAIAAAVTVLLDRSRARRRARSAPAAPQGAGGRCEPAVPVDLLLELDRDYRARAAAGALPLIAPRRFNPEGRAWLPVWHTDRGGWHVTALYSNTARAHELGRVRDWVVLYLAGRDGSEQQFTVVTESRGGRAGRRVVRGREAECDDATRASGAP